MSHLLDRLEELLELGGTKKEIVLLVISGLALIASIFHLLPLPSTPPGSPLCCAASPLCWRPSSA